MNTTNTITGGTRNRASTQAETEQIMETEELEETTGRDSPAAGDETRLAALFTQDVANDYRARWDGVQTGFVDDPGRAVRQGDELVAQVLKDLSESFSKERAKLESRLGKTDQASTETLRQALRRYRSFFERLLSV